MTERKRILVARGTHTVVLCTFKSEHPITRYEQHYVDLHQYGFLRIIPFRPEIDDPDKLWEQEFPQRLLELHRVVGFVPSQISVNSEIKSTEIRPRWWDVLRWLRMKPRKLSWVKEFRATCWAAQFMNYDIEMEVGRG